MKSNNKILPFIRITILILFSNLIFYFLFIPSADEGVLMPRENFSKIMIKAKLKTPFVPQKEILIHDPQSNTSAQGIFMLSITEAQQSFQSDEKEFQMIVIEVPDNLLSFFFKKNYEFEVYPKEYLSQSGVQDVSF